MHLQRSALTPIKSNGETCFICGEVGQAVAYDVVCKGCVCEDCIKFAVGAEVAMITAWSGKRVRHPHNEDFKDGLR